MRGQMVIISPLLREKINVFVEKLGSGRSQASFVVIDEGSGIVKLFNIIPSILLGTVFFPADQVFDALAFSLFDLALVKEFLYLKTLHFIGIALNKYRRRVG